MQLTAINSHIRRSTGPLVVDGSCLSESARVVLMFHLKRHNLFKLDTSNYDCLAGRNILNVVAFQTSSLPGVLDW